MNMPWLPMTVQHKINTAPNWYPFYPPPVDLRENGFYELVDSGVVTIYYYNCGVRQEKEITTNPDHVTNDVNLVDFTNDGKNSGYGYCDEPNRIQAGESNIKSIVGWTNRNKANPDNKSEFANNWRKDNEF